MENQQGLFLFVPFIGEEYDPTINIDYSEVERRAQLAIDILSLYNAENPAEKENISSQQSINAQFLMS